MSISFNFILFHLSCFILWNDCTVFADGIPIQFVFNLCLLFVLVETLFSSHGSLSYVWPTDWKCLCVRMTGWRKATCRTDGRNEKKNCSTWILNTSFQSNAAQQIGLTVVLYSFSFVLYFHSFGFHCILFQNFRGINSGSF